MSLDNVFDFLRPVLKQAADHAERQGKPYALLVYQYLTGTVLPELRRIAALTPEQAQAEADAAA